MSYQPPSGGARTERAEVHHRPPAAQQAGQVQAVTCTLSVPAQPLTAQGLATPYTLARGCDEANADQSAFVEATVVDPATGALSVYHPLVINAGSRPAVAPVLPVLPANAVVGIWFGFNGDTLKLAGPGSATAVNGLGNSLFGQFAYINAPQFFTAAQKAGAKVPALGKTANGELCPTVRDFRVVDQDQSDNVNTIYLNVGGRLAQNTTANAARGGVAVKNASDNGLLSRLIAPALGCATPTAASLDDPGKQSTSLALNELQAAQQQAPVALVPINDPMALVNGKQSVQKTQMYRQGVGQPLTGIQGSAKPYCADLKRIAPNWIRAHRADFQGPSPDAAMSLFQFLTDRYAATVKNLGC